MKDRISNLSNQYFDDVVKCRRHLHANPELSYHEYETAQFISSKLNEYGIEHETGIANTGVVGIIKGKNTGKKVIALRADTDALPITEINDISYKSQNEGVMHACGHDVHTASLLGASRILNEIKNDFEGTIKLIFQPAEERFPSGAKSMIEAGVLKNPEVELIFGQHVSPEIEVGKVGFKPGIFMASADEIYITINGKGGHAARPHHTIDPILIASQVIVALQQVVSRNADPAMPSVLSFGKIVGNGATNIIPEKVELAGTFRTFDENWRRDAHQKIERITKQIAESMGGTAIVNIDAGCPALTCDENTTNRSMQAASEYLGNENVNEIPIRLGAEDFAHYTQVIPACFYRLGVGNAEKGINSGLHTPTFNIDEEALKVGSGLMAFLAYSELNY